MPIVSIFHACKDCKPLIIASTEERAWAALDTFWGYEKSEHHRWTVVREERDIPIVEGVAMNYGTKDDPRPHVKWDCPACGEDHHTDLEPDETNPALWGCERSRIEDNLHYLVQWRWAEDRWPFKSDA